MPEKCVSTSGFFFLNIKHSKIFLSFWGYKKDHFYDSSINIAIIVQNSI